MPEKKRRKTKDKRAPAPPRERSRDEGSSSEEEEWDGMVTAPPPPRPDTNSDDDSDASSGQKKGKKKGKDKDKPKRKAVRTPRWDFDEDSALRRHYAVYKGTPSCLEVLARLPTLHKKGRTTTMVKRRLQFLKIWVRHLTCNPLLRLDETLTPCGSILSQPSDDAWPAPLSLVCI